MNYFIILRLDLYRSFHVVGWTRTAVDFTEIKYARTERAKRLFLCKFVLVAVVFVHEKACLTFRRHRACRMPCVSGDVTIADTTDSDSLLILGQLIITQRTRI